MTLQEFVLTSTYEDMVSVIHNTVHRFHRRHGGDREEMLAEAHLYFLNAYQKWKPEKSGFRTWLINMITWKLFNLRAAEKKYVELPEEVIGREPSQFSLQELLEELSEDARQVIGLVLDSPMDVVFGVRVRGNPTRKNVRGAVREFLRDLGWTARRVSETYMEIGELLR